ncbi:S-adenosyl-L-methionine-dependent methyltransferase [Hypoxylon argillaceum]|nr:S-adenosyl-L-methionine-dependent methyltransferase [Hypoxylon argillaceum]
MASPTATPRVTQLAEMITVAVSEIQRILTQTSSPFPSFDEDAPAALPLELADARDAALEAASELFDILSDPIAMIRRQGAHNNSICLQAIGRYKIASMITPGGKISFADIAKSTGISEQIVCRLMRHAMTMRIFYEPEPGFVSHTKASRILADPIASDWLKAGTDEMWPAAVHMMDAVQRWPNSSEPSETGYSVSNSKTLSIYDAMGSSPDRAMCLANSMKMFATFPEYDPVYLTNSYDWAALGAARVLDIGGARGHVAIELAANFPQLDITVQDMDKVVDKAEEGLPEQLRDRVKFEAHDLFAEQTTPADLLLFRWVLHNWSDKHCLQILRAQLPVLKPNARIIIQDVIMPEPGTIPVWKEKDLRSSDLDMAAVFNSQERTLQDWKTLLLEANPRFVVNATKEPKGSALGIIEVVVTEDIGY